MKPLFLAKLFVVGLFIPGEFHLSLGGLRLELYRIVLGIAVVSSGLMILNKGFKRLQITDKGIVFVTTLGALSLILNHGMGEGIEKAGIFSFEVFGSYFLARQAIVNEKALFEVYRLLGIMVMLFLLPTLIEMMTGYKVVHEFAKAITGRDVIGQALYGEKYIRAGLTRSTSAFSHPILNGTICAAAIPFAFYFLIRYKKATYLFMLVSAFLSVVSALSSAPLLVLVAQFGLVAYVKVKQVLKKNMRLLVIAVGVGAAILHFTSNRGLVKLIIQTATFNPHTGTHRLLIIEHIQDDIMRHPFFGSGLDAYWSAPGWMGQSIDNFWLALSFTYGIPFAVSVAAIAFTCLAKIKVAPVPVRADFLAYSVKASIISMLVLGLTVHLFGKIFPLFFFLMGSSVYLFFPKQKSKRTVPAEELPDEGGSDVKQ